MIDIHSHILPGIDDGAQTEQDSLAMAKAAVEDGISTIFATPHHRNGAYDNDRDAILKSVDLLNKLLESENVPLNVLPGQEVRINGDYTEELKSGELLPLNHTRYIMVEFASGHVPRYAMQMLFDIQVIGFIPIIVHPERNRELLERPKMLHEFVKKGALTQITAGSVTGKFGKNVQKFTQQIIEANLTHFIASDAHNTTTRGFSMTDAFEFVSKEYGMNLAHMYLDNAELLAEGENVNRLEPELIRKKKFLGLF